MSCEFTLVTDGNDLSLRYEMKNVQKSIALELFYAVVASAFLGFATLFLMLLFNLPV